MHLVKSELAKVLMTGCETTTTTTANLPVCTHSASKVMKLRREADVVNKTVVKQTLHAGG